MEQVKVFCDRTGNTLTVWFGEPGDEFVAEETGDEVVLMKDSEGRVVRHWDHYCADRKSFQSGGLNLRRST